MKKAKVGGDAQAGFLPPREALEKFGRLVRAALKEGASAIHAGHVFDEATQRSGARLCFRVGVGLKEVRSLTDAEFAELLAQAKQMSDLDLAERRMPQDGRMMLGIDGKRIDLLVSTAPCVLGEQLCMRIFEHAEIGGGVAMLGLSEEAAATVRGWCRRSHGLVLLAGPGFPTHSGTLYALVGEARDGCRVVTVEDPVESVLAGVQQVQVEPRLGLTAARAIRAAMRQDPDVLAIAGIGDRECATLAVQAARAGHLVLAGVGGLDAADALAELVSAGVDPRLLSQALVGVLAWDQMSGLCGKCREPYAPHADELAGLGPHADRLRGRAFRARGCASCAEGRAGTVRLYEALAADAGVRRAVCDGCSAETLRAEAGANTLAALACASAAAGEIGLEDAVRLCARTEGRRAPAVR